MQPASIKLAASRPSLVTNEDIFLNSKFLNSKFLNSRLLNSKVRGSDRDFKPLHSPRISAKAGYGSPTIPAATNVAGHRRFMSLSILENGIISSSLMIELLRSNRAVTFVPHNS